MSVSDLCGKILLDVYLEKAFRCDEKPNAIFFRVTDGIIYKLYHERKCCDRVYIDDIKISSELPDFECLKNTPILFAEKTSKIQDKEEWHFFKLSTIKGSVDIIFHGTSKGCNSMDVKMEFAGCESFIDLDDDD